LCRDAGELELELELAGMVTVVLGSCEGPAGGTTNEPFVDGGVVSGVDDCRSGNNAARSRSTSSLLLPDSRMRGKMPKSLMMRASY